MAQQMRAKKPTRIPNNKALNTSGCTKGTDVEIYTANIRIIIQLK